jgi:hypothetical protein
MTGPEADRSRVRHNAVVVRVDLVFPQASPTRLRSGLGRFLTVAGDAFGFGRTRGWPHWRVGLFA